ncbi:MAG: class I SAM-dependent methyltransferase [Thermoleophilaceae bacterium]
MRRLWRLFRSEKTDPGPFYRMLGAELADELGGRYGPLAGQTIVDLGCGPGFYTEALRAKGASVIPVDNDLAEMEMVGSAPDGALLADAADLPLDADSIDGALCSNLLEHTPDAAGVIREIERVLRPGGWGYISWTNWYSPWGGHDMTPYQYLGPKLGPRLYERVHGPPRKNPYGDGLWAVHVGPTIREVRGRPRLRVERIEPRYWPGLRFICRIPLVRELLTWNCVIRVVKT